MGPVAEIALAEAAEVVAFPVKHHDRVLAPGQDINVVLRVHRNTWTLKEPYSIGQLGPIVDVPIEEIALSVSIRHISPYSR
jgi:hypothetical protein